MAMDRIRAFVWQNKPREFMAPVRWILIQRFVFKIWLFSCLLSRQVQDGRDRSRKCWKILYVNSLQPAWEWCTDMAMIRIRNGGVWRPISNWWCRCEENGCWECVRPAHVIYCSRKINQVIFCHHILPISLYGTDDTSRTTRIRTFHSWNFSSNLLLWRAQCWGHRLCWFAER